MSYYLIPLIVLMGMQANRESPRTVIQERVVRPYEPSVPCPKGQQRELLIPKGGVLIFTNCDGSPAIRMDEAGISFGTYVPTPKKGKH